MATVSRQSARIMVMTSLWSMLLVLRRQVLCLHLRLVKRVRRIEHIDGLSMRLRRAIGIAYEARGVCTVVVVADRGNIVRASCIAHDW